MGEISIMRFIALLFGIVLPLIVAGCLGGGPRMQAIELTDAQKLFKTKTTFKEGVIGVEVREKDGTTRTLDSALNYQYSTTYLPPPAIPGFSNRAWQLTENAHDGRTFVYALVSWDQDDPADYLSAGWWLRLPPGVSFRNRNEAETGVFIDGPELDLSSPPQLPAEGEATFVGTMGGLYRYTSPAGELEDHEFAAVLNLTANFADGTISGCAGCIGDIETQRVYLYSLLGWRSREPSAPPTDYQVHFGATPFSPEGTFENTGITVTHPERTVTRTQGQWAGQFSNVPDGQGHPRRIVGFTDVEFGEADDSGARFVGIFEALSPAYVPPPESEAP